MAATGLRRERATARTPHPEPGDDSDATIEVGVILKRVRPAEQARQIEIGTTSEGLTRAQAGP
jgi:hypothetical protein